MKKQIIVLGGGGFSMEPDNPSIDNYILAQAQIAQPNVCFISTAGGDNKGYIQRFYDCYNAKPCRPTHLALFDLQFDDIPGLLLAQHIIFVGGGSTKNLMALWQHWGLDQLLVEAYHRGIILAGISAGANCWFEEGFSEVIIHPAIETQKRLQSIAGIGLLEGSFCPHFDGEMYRQVLYQEWVSKGKIKPGWAADDGAGIHFINGQVHRIFSSRQGATVYAVGVNQMTPVTKGDLTYLS